MNSEPSFIMQENSQKSASLVEAIIKNEEGKILLLKRSDVNIFYKGKWQLPGGKVDFGENMTVAIQRELKEETNCGCKNLVLEKVFSFYQEFNGFSGTHFLMIFNCDLVGDLKLSEDHDEYAYFSINEIKKLHLAPNSKKAIFE